MQDAKKSHIHMSMRASLSKCTLFLMRLSITNRVHSSHTARKNTLKSKCLECNKETVFFT